MGYLERPGSGSASGSVAPVTSATSGSFRRKHTEFQWDGEWREPHDGFRKNTRAVLEGGLAGCIRVRQHRSVDMDHDLISLARRAGIDAVVQGRLGEQSEGISLLLRDGGRFRGNAHRARITGLRTGPLIQSLARGSESLHE